MAHSPPVGAVALGTPAAEPHAAVSPPPTEMAPEEHWNDPDIPVTLQVQSYRLLVPTADVVTAEAVAPPTQRGAVGAPEDP